MGDVTLFRLYTGEIRNGGEVFNAEHETVEKLNHLSVQQGKERMEVERLSAGDIGSVAKLKDTHTGDTFCWREAPVRLPPIPFPEAVATSAVVVKQRGEEDKLAAGLHKLHEEDPTFHFEYSSELGQTLIHGMGERHFDTILHRLERKFGVHAELVRPRVAYRETIKGRAEGQGKHKKQSGRTGPVRRLLDPGCAATPGVRLRVRERDRGRGDSRESTSRRWIGEFRRPRCAASLPAIRWSISRSSASTGPTTTWTPTRCRSRWPASWLSETLLPRPGRCCSSR